jgi:hypothetical protein
LTIARNGEWVAIGARTPRARRCQECSALTTGPARLLARLHRLATARGIALDGLLPELRAAFHQAVAQKDRRAEHQTWAAIVAITAVSDSQPVGAFIDAAPPAHSLPRTVGRTETPSASDTVPARYMALTGAS